MINLFKAGCSDTHFKTLVFKYHSHGELEFKIEQVGNILKFHNVEHDIHFELDREDIEDCDYAEFSLGLSI